MSRKHLIQLVLLAAIWGGAFMLLRVAAPAMGAAWIAAFRAVFAALAMLALLLVTRQALRLDLHTRHYVVLGLINLALPYLCFSFAATRLPTAYLALINATSALFTVLWAYAWDRTPVTWRKFIGMLLGIVGVALLVGLGPVPLTADTQVAIAVVLIAPFCYGFCGLYMRKFTSQVGSHRLVAGTQFVAVLVLVPLALTQTMPGAPSVTTWAAAIGLGVIGTAYGFILFYKLVAEAGPEKAMTVTYLMPVFSMFWGWLVLGESVTWVMLGGCAVILGGTALILLPAGSLN